MVEILAYTIADAIKAAGLGRTTLMKRSAPESSKLGKPVDAL